MLQDTLELPAPKGRMALLESSFSATSIEESFAQHETLQMEVTFPGANDSEHNIDGDLL